MNFGGIELDQKLGGYEIVNKPATSLPQDVATAMGKINEGLLGASYLPIWYVGHQVVNGMNHLLICQQVKTTKNADQAVVALTLNIPAGNFGDQATVVDITEETNLSEDLQYAFDMAVRPLVGVVYKPLAFVGKQVVKGVNLYFICSARRVYPGSKPYAAMVCVNQFEGAFVVVSIEPLLPQVESNGKSLSAAPLGEWP